MASGPNAFTVASEFGVLKDVYLCRPDHFQWSDLAKEDTAANAVVRATLQDGALFDKTAALAGYQEFIDAYEGAGVRCHFADTDPALSYQIYTRDPSVMTPWGVFLGQMYRQQRRGEIATTYRFYEKRGIPVWNWATAGPIEGGDIHLIKPGIAVIGYTGQRTCEPAARQLQAWLEAEGWECRLQKFAEHFLHLDLLYATVNDRLALMCLDVLPDDFVEWLAGHQTCTGELQGQCCSSATVCLSAMTAPFHRKMRNGQQALCAKDHSADPDLSCSLRRVAGHGAFLCHCCGKRFRKEHRACNL